MFFIKITKIRIILSITALSLGGFTLNAQDYGREQFIKDFKEASLLVRLQDKSLSLAELEKRGLSKRAEQLKQQQYQENRETLLSFSKTFDFCPVYFFYASESEAIRNGNYAGKVFNADLQPSEVKTAKVFIAEFDETEELGIDGLIVKDDKMLALPEDLPYFERRFILIGLIERSKAEMVEAYNHKLQEYYDMLNKP